MTPSIRILVCPNAFKGSLSAIEAARAIAFGIERANDTEDMSSTSGKRKLYSDLLPLADGGDGTLETLVEATGGRVHTTVVHGPLGDPVEAVWGSLGGDLEGTAIIEMAKASGLNLLTAARYDPLHSCTYGTGELMLTAARFGCTRLLIGIGGSATNDGGAGMARALGARLLDRRGRAVPRGGAGLLQLAEIDTTGWKLPSEVEVIVACDVDNPLIGPTGASAVYGPQKGATAEMVSELDDTLKHYGNILALTFGKDLSTTPGAGAAGGLGAGLCAFCSALLKPGAEMVLDAVGFNEKLRDCALAITGEGHLDSQTARGKVIGAVATRALKAGKPCIALVGGVSEGADRSLASRGLTATFCISNGPASLIEAIQSAEALLADTAERAARLIGRLM